MNNKLIEWANAGDADAMFKVGATYLKGEGSEQDYSKAIEYFTKASNAGYDNADYELGKMYREGKGVETDYSKAIEYFKKAAKWNHMAIESILDMCQQGQGVAQNDKGILDFVIDTLNKKFTNIYTNNVLQRVMYFKTRRPDEFTMQYEIGLELRRMLNLAHSLKERSA